MGLFPIELAYLVKTRYRTDKKQGDKATLYFTPSGDSVEVVTERNKTAIVVEPIYKGVFDTNKLYNILAGFGPIAVNLFAGDDLEYVDLAQHLPFEYRCLQTISQKAIPCFIMIEPSSYRVLQTFSAPTQVAVDILTDLSHITMNDADKDYSIERIRTSLYTLGTTTTNESVVQTYMTRINYMLDVLKTIEFETPSSNLLGGNNEVTTDGGDTSDN